MTLTQLLEKVEAATEGSRALDRKLAVAVGGFFVRREQNRGDRYCYIDADGVEHRPGQAGDMMVPYYSGSLDAAIVLVEAKLPDIRYTLTKRTVPYLGEYPFEATLWGKHPTRPREGASSAFHRRSLSLALLAALLRALIAQESTP